MGDILNEASDLVECQQCPWYKTCVSPLRFSIEDLKREMEQTIPGMSWEQTGGQELYRLLANTAAAAQNMVLEACPIFVRRLKSNPKLAENIKKMMQSWGTEECDSSPDDLHPLF